MDAHEKVQFFNLSLGNVTLTFSKKETLLKRPKCSGLSFVQGSWHDQKWTPFCAPENIDPPGTPAPFSAVLNVFADSVYRMMNFPLCNLLNLTQRRSINFVPHAGIDSCCSDTGCIVRETYYLPTPLTNKLFFLSQNTIRPFVDHLMASWSILDTITLSQTPLSSIKPPATSSSNL
jgi:hypothetical protein